MAKKSIEKYGACEVFLDKTPSNCTHFKFIEMSKYIKKIVESISKIP